MKTGRSKALWEVWAVAVVAAAVGAVTWLDAGQCNGFKDWAKYASCFFKNDTLWAEGYSEEGFLKIEPGMTEEDVVRLAGRPLFEWRDPWKGAWDYSWRKGSGWKRQVYFSEDWQRVLGTQREYVVEAGGTSMFLNHVGWGQQLLLAAKLLVAAWIVCCFRLGRRVVVWTAVAAVLLVFGGRLVREAGNVVSGRGVGVLERAGWRWVADDAQCAKADWSKTYVVGAEGMSRGWVGLTAWQLRDCEPGAYYGKLRLEWVDGEGRTVRESVVGAEGPEGLAFLPSAGGREGPAHERMLPLEALDTAWVAEREAAEGLRLRVSVAEPDLRHDGCPMDFCIWLAK